MTWAKPTGKYCGEYRFEKEISRLQFWIDINCNVINFRMQSKPVVFYLFMTYATIEIVRYPYYMLRVYDIDFGLITWLR